MTELKLTSPQISRIMTAMESKGACNDFVESNFEMLKIIRACVLTTLRELDEKQVQDLFESI